MANTIRLKSGSGNNPSASDLVVGEVALRTDGNPKLFTKNDAGNVLEVGLVESGSIVAGSIVNADINASAAIAGTKISPDFGSQNITTTNDLNGKSLNLTHTSPQIQFIDSNGNPDYTVKVDSGLYKIIDATNSNADRFVINTDGHIDIAGNVDFAAGIDVTGNISCSGTATFSGNAITIEGTHPDLIFTDTNNDDDFQIHCQNGTLAIKDIGSGDRFIVNSDGHIDITAGLDITSGGLDVTGNITVTGTIAPSTIDMEDDEKIKLGNSDDLEIYHDSNNSYVQDTGTGNLVLKGTQVVIQSGGSNKSKAIFRDNGASELYHGISSSESSAQLKIATTTTGVSVTGNIAVSGTVDGVDVATRDTLFGGLTSSSGVLTNGVTATTQSAGDNSTKVATTAYTDTAISNLVDSSPSTLNTLNELAAALGDDANFSTTVTNSIATKMPLAGGAFTGDITTRNMTPPSGVTNIDIGSSSLKYRNLHLLGNIVVDGYVDNRDIAADGTKLDGIESNAINASNTAITNKLPLAGGTLTGTLNGVSIDLSSQLLVGANDTRFAENNLRFKSSGHAYIDHNTTGQNINFRVSNSSSLDTTPLVVHASGINVTGNITATGDLTVSSGDVIIQGVEAKLHLTDTNNDDDYLVFNNNGTFKVYDATNNADRLQINSSGVVTIGGNTNFGDGIDVTGDVTITKNIPVLKLIDSDNNDDFALVNRNGLFVIRDDTDGADRFTIASNGRATLLNDVGINGNLDVGNGLDVTGAISLAANSDIRFTNGTWSGDFTKIQHHSNYLYIVGGSSGIIFREGNVNRWIVDGDGHLDPATDSTYDIGQSDRRVRNGYFDTLYGDGSNLTGLTVNNANTLDNLDSTQFLRSDTNTLLNGILTVGGSSVSGNEGGEIRFTHSPNSSLSGNEIVVDVVNSNLRFFEGGGNTRGFYLDLSTASNSAAGKIFHTGNDGSGSGLDADTLDGVQASGFVAVGGDTMTSNLRIDIDSTVDGIVGEAYNTYFGLKHSDQDLNSEYMILSKDFDTFISATSGYKVRLRAGGNDSTNELQVGSGNDALTWRANKVFHAGNDGSGSGLDADTLDGVQGSSYLRSDSSDTMSANLTITGRLDVGDGTGNDMEIRVFKADNNVSDHIQFYNGTTRVGEIGCHDASWLRINQESGANIYTPRMIRADNGFQVDGITVVDGSANVIGARVSGTVANATRAENLAGYSQSDSASTNTIVRRNSNGYIFANYFNTTSNDTGTGTDVTRFYASEDAYIRYLDKASMRAVMNTSARSSAYAGRENNTSNQDYWLGTAGWGNQNFDTTVWDFGSCFFDTWADPSGEPSGTSHWNGFQAMHYTNASSRYGMRITMGAGQTALAYIQGRWNQTTYGWHKLWNEGNDGSGSGLDADKLDGVEGSNYLRSDTGDAMNGNLTLKGELSIENTVSGINNAYSEFITFKTSQTNGQSATTGRIVAQGQSAWGGDLIFYTKPANSSPNNTVSERVRVTAEGTTKFILNGTPSDDSTCNIILGRHNTGNEGGQMGFARANDNHTLWMFDCYGNNNQPKLRMHRDGAEMFSFNYNGNFYRAGSTLSDRDLKENIQDLTGTSLDQIIQLSPKTFNFKESENYLAVPKTGFIAQEVASVMPSLVNGTDGEKDMGVDFDGIVAHLVNSVKELKALNDSLKARIEALESK